MPDEPQSLRFSPEAEWAFACHVADAEAGRGKSFEALCGEHPELAEELRGLKAQWEQVAGVVQHLLKEPSVASARPQASGAIGTGSGGQTAAGDELVRQLAEHSPPASRYELRGEFAHGGMGEIHKVWDKDLRRELAMKLIRSREDTQAPGSTLAVDELTLARFLDEAQVTGQLDHPGVVPVHELGLDAHGKVYFTMRLVKGKNLGEVLELVREEKDGWTRTRVLGVLLKVCEAMAYSHSKGVVHRDLKPSNVMVGRFGEVYVMDWGLARVIGRKDQHDLRIQRAVPTKTMRTARSERAAETPDSPIITMDGTVVGTPSYMPPEQAEGRVEELGPAADVYALGSILYELLTGQKPYVRVGSHPSPHTILAALLQGPPTRIEDLVKDVPAELVAICERAMTRDPARRYADMSALAEDLSAFLEHRVVRAYQTGAAAELRKWVERNRGMAASLAGALVLLVAGLGTALVLRQKARESEKRREEVVRLSAIQDLEDLLAEADALWPALPASIDAYKDWIRRARALVADLTLHRLKRAELGKTALPRSEEQRRAERENHPEWARLQALEGELAFRRRALLERRDGVAAEVPVVEWDRYPEQAIPLNEVAWPMVKSGRKRFGEEPRALALAQRAFERATPEEKHIVGDTIAWALFALGRDDEALAASRAALATAPKSSKAEFEGYLTNLERAVEEVSSSAALRRAESELAELESEHAAVDARVDERRDWRFPEEERESRWWHNQLSKLVTSLEDLAAGLLSEVQDAVQAPHGWSIPHRLAVAEHLRSGFAPDGEYARRWQEALPRLKAKYPGIAMQAQVGLVPLDPDPVSGLWEFADLSTGEVPERTSDGRLPVSEETGLVFVLLPGGLFPMGAQDADPGAPNYDTQVTGDETPVRDVELSPFFLSKYEMTQAQWQRVTGAQPSHIGPRNWDRDWNRYEAEPRLTHPVEKVSWSECALQCERLGLALPTEAQWEYAVRGGTLTPWWFGEDASQLSDAGNVPDQRVKPFGQIGVKYAPWDDGATVHLPVDAQLPNPFGFHGMLGNVWEWCADGYHNDAYRFLPVLDPVAPANLAVARARRGGSFGSPYTDTRSANRGNNNQDAVTQECGLRPARALQLR